MLSSNLKKFIFSDNTELRVHPATEKEPWTVVTNDRCLLTGPWAERFLEGLGLDELMLTKLVGETNGLTIGSKLMKDVQPTPFPKWERLFTETKKFQEARVLNMSLRNHGAPEYQYAITIQLKNNQLGLVKEEFIELARALSIYPTAIWQNGSHTDAILYFSDDDDVRCLEDISATPEQEMKSGMQIPIMYAFMPIRVEQKYLDIISSDVIVLKNFFKEQERITPDIHDSPDTDAIAEEHDRITEELDEDIAKHEAEVEAYSNMEHEAESSLVNNDEQIRKEDDTDKVINDFINNCRKKAEELSNK